MTITELSHFIILFFFFFCVVQQILAEVYCFFIKVLYMHKVDSIEM